MLILTYREIQIIKFTSYGYTAKEIARKLNLGYRTIEKYSQNIRKKLNARNMTHAVFIAIRDEIISVPNSQLQLLA